MKKRILLVHNYYQIPGGEDTVVRNEKKLLEDNGNIVFLYTRNNREIKSFNIFQKLLVPFKTIFNFKTYRDIKKIIKEKKIDIVHVHNTLALISPSVFYAAKKFKIPIIQTIHNFRMECPSGTFYRDNHICEDCLKKGLGCSLKHKCYRNSFWETLFMVIGIKLNRKMGIYKKAYFICLTEFNRQKLLEINKLSKNIIIDESHCFVKPNFTFDSSKELITFANRENVFIFAGRLEINKGFKWLLENWKRNYPDLLVFGEGSLKMWGIDFIKKNKIKNILLKGQLPHDELLDFIKISKAVIVPSLWFEGFPMLFLEAMSFGTPLLASNIGNASNLIKEGINGWHFQIENSETLKTGIENVENQDIMDKEIQYFQLNFSSKKNFQTLEQIYKKILEKN